MADTVIAPDLRELYDSAKGFSTLESWMGPLSKRVMELIERVSKAEQENVALRAKLQQISDWCEAYPLDVFTEPDMVEVRKLLGDTLLTQLSAHNFRHVIDGIKQIAARGREGESEVQP